MNGLKGFFIGDHDNGRINDLKVANNKMCSKMCHLNDAGWSSLAARRAHNPKVVGSNPAPATKLLKNNEAPLGAFFVPVIYERKIAVRSFKASH